MDWWATVQGVARVGQALAKKPPPPPSLLPLPLLPPLPYHSFFHPPSPPPSSSPSSLISPSAHHLHHPNLSEDSLTKEEILLSESPTPASDLAAISSTWILR